MPNLSFVFISLVFLYLLTNSTSHFFRKKKTKWKREMKSHFIEKFCIMWFLSEFNLYKLLILRILGITLKPYFIIISL